MSIALWVLIAVVVIALLFWWMQRGSAAINDYFVNAVTVYALGQEEVAHVAALTVATVAAGKQRASMLVFLNGMAGDCSKFPNGDQIKSRLLALAKEIGQKGNDLQTIMVQKQQLGSMNKELLAALERFDASIFKNRWPQFF